MHDPLLKSEALALIATGFRDGEIGELLGVKRTTVRDWRRLTPSTNFEICHRCWGRMRPIEPSIEDYSYLLGFYLGDGCISELPRTQSLRISLDPKYPGIVSEVEEALSRCFPWSKVQRVRADEGRTLVLSIYAQHLSCLFPQAGTGKKHERCVKLEPWQAGCVGNEPWAFIKGCIQTDGCVFVNRTGPYEYLSYGFSNYSKDILVALSWALSMAGVEHRRTDKSIRINRRASVQLMLENVGLKT